MKAILDTSVLVDEVFDAEQYEVSVSSLSWAELRYGVRKAREPGERARRETRLLRLRALLGDGVPFDDSAAIAYEAICGLVLTSGRDVRGRVVDMMIAATAAAHGAAVLTRNPDDFAGIESLVPIIAI